ncbi:MAG TPA: excinuclease ABC subunit UvrC [Candidatus Gracilibacteria bacterium]|nr:excinuclease ABC subunit UvrC [Candidatus Gracilibacteria bacterium]
MDQNNNLAVILKNLPHQAGVYQMKDQTGKIIYVGKAKDLKKRVSSYFQNSKQLSVKTQKLVEQIADISCTIVNSETEAFLLETNLIKTERPKYNILMKDDKNFSYLKIDLTQDFPRFEIVRQREKNKNFRYFGPYLSKKKILHILDFLQKIFPLPTCKLQIKIQNEQIICEGNEKYPCLEYQMKRCLAPCIGGINKIDYHLIIQKIISFLQGNYQELTQQIKEEIQIAAQKQEFEKAARLKKIWDSIQSLQEKQIITDTKDLNQDVLAYYKQKEEIFFSFWQIREGKLIHSENLVYQSSDLAGENPLRAFITSFYHLATDLPREIILSEEIEETHILEEWWQIEFQQKVKILIPQRGKNNQLIKLAEINAKHFAEQSLASFENKISREESEKTEMIELLNFGLKTNLYNFPARMEAMDISHFGGEDTVASLVVFQDGKPQNSEYRHYQIKTLIDNKIDDFASMSELFNRRCSEIETQILRQKQVIDPNYHCELLSKKMVLAENLDLNLIHYQITDQNNQKFILSFRKFAKQVWQWTNPQKDLQKAWLNLLNQIKAKELWVLGNENLLYESYGFQLVKKLGKNWESKLIPEDLAKENAETLGFAYRLKIKLSNSKIPQLILIDGGKGQLDSVVQILEKRRWTYQNMAFHWEDIAIQILSLAKAEEEIFFPYEKTPRPCPSNSAVSFLMQRIRDEAHRFAISFQKNQRLKSSMKSKNLF